jgi:hypothetical protein
MKRLNKVYAIAALLFTLGSVSAFSQASLSDLLKNQQTGTTQGTTTQNATTQTTTTGLGSTAGIANAVGAAFGGANKNAAAADSASRSERSGCVGDGYRGLPFDAGRRVHARVSQDHAG